MCEGGGANLKKILTLSQMRDVNSVSGEKLMVLK